MGVGPRMSSSMIGSSQPIANRNPDPWHYVIKSVETVNDHLIISVNCTNYEGNKLLLMEKGYQMRAGNPLDPHFQPDDKHPIARFEPTTRGLRMARACAKILNGDD